MAEEAAAAVIGKFVEHFCTLVGQQLKYVFRYNHNIKQMKKKVELLKAKRSTVERSAKAANDDCKVVGDDVLQWLEHAEEGKVKAEQVLSEIEKIETACVNMWCLDLKSRYWLSRKSTMTTKDLVDLLARGELQKLSCHPQPLEVLPLADNSEQIHLVPDEGHKDSTSGISRELKSRSAILDSVMVAVRDVSISTIGICGMGGVGKTTLVKELIKRVKKELLFDEIAFVVVSQNPDVRSIQLGIADFLGLNIKEDSSVGRASRLHLRLTGKDLDGKKKRILVILDDVWKMLDFSEIGIRYPEDREGCRVVITSRSIEVCHHMNAASFHLPVLLEEEAWSLFQGSLRDSASYPVAKAIVAKCGGLPIAITTIAMLLAKKEENTWNHVLQQLNTSSLQGEYEKVYKVFQVSFANLEPQEIKDVFLLCCLFPEDSNILVEDIVTYGMGLKVFKKIKKRHDARVRARVHIETLKKLNLLLESEKPECVKMHDLVRDFGISIASEGKFLVQFDSRLKEWPMEDSHEQWTHISMQCDEMNEFPSGLEYSNLKFLQMLGNKSKTCGFPERPDEAVGELQVLALPNISIPNSLLGSLKCLKNLRTLSLSGCEISKDISSIGNIEKLEFLSFANSNISELPKTIGKLCWLRSLDLTWCIQLQKITPGVLQSLTRLEELYMIGSSISWAEEITYDDKTGWWGVMTANSDDNNGESGEVTSNDDDNIVDSGEIMSNLDLYNGRWGDIPANGDYNGGERGEMMTNEDDFSGVLEIFTRPEEDEEIIFDDNNGELGEITVNDDKDSYACFTELNHLRQLVALEINIPYAFLPVDINLENLERFKIGIGGEGDLTYGPKEAHQNSLVFYGKEVFPLKGILKALCKKTGFLSVEVRDLKSLNSEVEENDLINLNTLICRWCVQMLYVFDSHYPSNFGNLRNLELTCCNKLKSLCSASIAGGFSNLEKLHIIKCLSIEEIFSTEKAVGDHQDETNVVELPKLREILLEELPNLDSFCNSVNNKFNLPRLKKLDFDNLSKLTSLSADSNFPDPSSSKYPFFHQQVTVNSMAELKIADMEHLTDLWHGETEDASSLKVIQQSKCLESLKVYGCNSLEVIYNINNGSEIVTLSTQLSYLCLSDLPKLTHVVKRAPHIVCQGFQYLKELDINKCQSLKSIFSLSIASGLAMLEEVQVIGCDTMHTIFQDDDEEIISAGDSNTIVFPRLKSLTFSDLPNLVGFCKSNNEVSLPQLQSLYLLDLPKLVGLNTDQKINVNWSSLECLIMGDCGILERTGTWTSVLGQSGTVQKRVNFTNVRKLNIMHSENMTTVFPENACPELQSIESMALADLPNIKSVWQNGPRVIKDFRNLDHLDISDCSSLKTLFTPYTAKNLIKLKGLSISNCETMEEIVAEQEGDDVISTEKKILFPNLVMIDLRDLPKLSSVLPMQYVFNWVSLKYFDVDEELTHLLRLPVTDN